jgi:NADH:ubiquinone oxidoreductase subunit F (NADH-binding)
VTDSAVGLSLTNRVLPAEPLFDRDAYERAGGGLGLVAARRLGAVGVVEHLLAAGLRGRGGAGFPTGRKWAEVAARTSASVPTTVVVNAAEGEPGSFKDRAILRRNPFAVLEGALIAAEALAADRVVVAVKSSFQREIAILRRAIETLSALPPSRGVVIELFEGPSAYLYGEETALLEAIDGRPPFPRVSPPYRYGVDEITPESDDAPPALVDNVETMANVPGIMHWGPAWFRELGTPQSPGTIVCTVSGDVDHAGVGEVPMGTPLREIIDAIGGGARHGHRLVAAMSGVANPVVPERLLDTPASYEGMEAIGSGLGAAGFIVFDDTTDPIALAHAVSRFLAVESCGQCTPCKGDGRALMGIFDRLQRGESHHTDLADIDDRLSTVADSARCFLATQHQRVVGSIVSLFRDDVRSRVQHPRASSEPEFVAALVAIEDGKATLDEHERDKQPDWSFDAVDSGKTPVDRLGRGHPAAARATREPRPRRQPAPPPPPPEHHDLPPGEVRIEDVQPDPESRLYSSEPLDTDEGTVVIQQQNVGAEEELGGGEWPDPHTPPREPAPGAD